MKILFLYLLLFSCNSNFIGLNQSKEGAVKWELKKLGDKKNYNGYLILDQDSYSAYIGCNYYTGKLKLNEREIFFLDGKRTEKECSKELQELETYYFDLLFEKLNYIHTPKNLILKKNNNEISFKSK
jgi:heat shock protein HslJ